MVRKQLGGYIVLITLNWDHQQFILLLAILLLCTLSSTMYANFVCRVYKQITMNSYRHCGVL